MAKEFETPSRSSVPDFLSDCRLMLRFARKNGADLSPELEHDIAQLDSILMPLQLPPVADIPLALVSKGVLGADGGPSAERMQVDQVAQRKTSTELILHLHGELSKAVAPATALSLQTTEPPPTGHTFFGGMPLVVRAAALAALFCALGFVTSAGVIASKAASDAKKVQMKGEAVKHEEAKKVDEKLKRADNEGEKK